MNKLNYLNQHPSAMFSENIQNLYHENHDKYIKAKNKNKRGIHTR